MRIREAYAIKDRIKLIIFLLFILIWMIFLAVNISDNTQEMKQATIERLLKTAMEPVGSTMYIWGGGWNGEDSGAGSTATQIGLSPSWKAFANQQDENYDFRDHRFEREMGLDCSGYVGWVIYNIFETASGRPGYVTTSTDMAESLAKRGWGEVMRNPKEFLPGDIVSMEGHVWICLGTCEDGSVILVHSSPPGVSVSATKQESIAVRYATEYMKNYHNQWQEKYPNRCVPLSYLENVSVFRWNSKVMKDAKEFQEKTGEEIMILLSSGM